MIDRTPNTQSYKTNEPFTLDYILLNTVSPDTTFKTDLEICEQIYELELIKKQRFIYSTLSETKMLVVPSRVVPSAVPIFYLHVVSL